MQQTERAREMLLMGMRLTEGIEPARFAARTGVALEAALDPSVLRQALDEGYLVWRDGCLWQRRPGGCGWMRCWARSCADRITPTAKINEPRKVLPLPFGEGVGGRGQRQQIELGRHLLCAGASPPPTPSRKWEGESRCGQRLSGRAWRIPAMTAERSGGVNSNGCCYHPMAADRALSASARA